MVVCEHFIRGLCEVNLCLEMILNFVMGREIFVSDCA